MVREHHQSAAQRIGGPWATPASRDALVHRLTHRRVHRQAHRLASGRTIERAMRTSKPCPRDQTHEPLSVHPQLVIAAPARGRAIGAGRSHDKERRAHPFARGRRSGFEFGVEGDRRNAPEQGRDLLESGAFVGQLPGIAPDVVKPSIRDGGQRGCHHGLAPRNCASRNRPGRFGARRSHGKAHHIVTAVEAAPWIRSIRLGPYPAPADRGIQALRPDAGAASAGLGIKPWRHPRRRGIDRLNQD